MDGGNVWRQRLAFAIVLFAAGSSVPTDETPGRESGAIHPSFVSRDAGTVARPQEVGRWRVARADDLESAPTIVPAYLFADEPVAYGEPAPTRRAGMDSPDPEPVAAGIGAILRF